jgi:hypothetical protein
VWQVESLRGPTSASPAPPAQAVPIHHPGKVRTKKVTDRDTGRRLAGALEERLARSEFRLPVACARHVGADGRQRGAFAAICSVVAISARDRARLSPPSRSGPAVVRLDQSALGVPSVRLETRAHARDDDVVPRKCQA